ncbi:hypothetical protein N7478_006031 [Penicillium angulare]|uniref:uncharacterized protein n=1 Tax=Penicillium angulare TaxID=116970 RepID=UPI0025412701|nr:uncharacterized protein N7478_006031 [Penicillium angulare]KAJ5280659.1 hypothetical protein N7478_006031 [Penicillium angulare]
MATSTTTATATSTARATAQGILQGGNPSHYDSSNPIVMFIIQLRFHRRPFAYNVRLGRHNYHFLPSDPLAVVQASPTYCDRRDHRWYSVGSKLLWAHSKSEADMYHDRFTETIFPTQSLQALSVMANLGIILFLFLVGLETDLRFLIKNWRVAASVSALGMILPFGLGCAISYGLYNQFQNDPGTVPVDFGTFLLFIGIAMAITAFPVLCRILTELKLLGTEVGVIVLSAGVGNDVVGWILLALCVALVNANSGITALYVLLVAVAYVLFLTFIFRPLFIRFLERTGSIQKGPSQSVVMMTLLIALASAFFTQVIGIHAIFGGFVVGLMCPHEGGFAIKVAEKIEDLVAIIFLPLYFALSGLSTNLGLLDNGLVWGYVVGIIAIAFIAKVTGGALASRWCGMLWRESFSIGVLMSCKGLVELIVLNIGLQAKILSTRTFTMFVVMALVTTFMTTPLTVSLYPNWYQVKVARWRRGEIDWNDNPLPQESRSDSVAAVKDQLKTVPVRKLLVYLRLDGLSGLCTLAALLTPTRGAALSTPRTHPSKAPKPSEQTVEEPTGQDYDEATALRVHGVRLMELTDRDSSVMKVSARDSALWDPVINTFRAFGEWHDISLMAGVSVVPEHSYADTVVNMARQDSSDLLLLPWSETGTLADRQNGLDVDPMNRFMNGEYAAFVSNVLDGISGNVGILIDHNTDGPVKKPSMQRSPSDLGIQASAWSRPPKGNRSHHLVFPFFGGNDDRFALRFVLQLAQNDQVTATVIQLCSSRSDSPKGTLSESSDFAFFETLRDSVPRDLQERVIFQSSPVQDTISDPAQVALTAVREELNKGFNKHGNIVVVGRSSGADASIIELNPDEIVGAGARQALGATASVMVQPDNKVFGSVLVLQAGANSVSSGDLR